jgi:hypothetical protein
MRLAGPAQAAPTPGAGCNGLANAAEQGKPGTKGGGFWTENGTPVSIVIESTTGEVRTIDYAALVAGNGGRSARTGSWTGPASRASGTAARGAATRPG